MNMRDAIVQFKVFQGFLHAGEEYLNDSMQAPVVLDCLVQLVSYLFPVLQASSKTHSKAHTNPGRRRGQRASLKTTTSMYCGRHDVVITRHAVEVACLLEEHKAMPMYARLAAVVACD